MDGFLKAQESGTLPVDVPTLDVPAQLGRPAHVVARFYARVWALHHDQLLPRAPMFASDWVARHTGLAPMTAYRALKRLEEAGVLRKAGELRLRSGRTVFLWAPGLPLSTHGVEAETEDAGVSVEPVGDGLHDLLVRRAEEARAKRPRSARPEPATDPDAGRHTRTVPGQGVNLVDPADELPPYPHERLHPTEVALPRNAILGME
ncbi:hypothetical protein OJ998_08815 [Solirubrobacter taibaiensis]|nr:hypothetical protein [Solirubrobacter taibaiensis]